MITARDDWSIWIKLCPEPYYVFLDEAGIKTNITAMYGWAKRGARCIGYAPGAWKSYTMLAAIGINKIIEGILIDGAVNKPAFKYFMEDLLLPQLPKGSTVIMDNLSVHKNSFNMELFNKNGIVIRYLPPYSPDLNPIENMWSKVKGFIRKLDPRNFDEIWHAMNEAFWNVTPANLAGWYRHCGYYT